MALRLDAARAGGLQVDDGAEHAALEPASAPLTERRGTAPAATRRQKRDGPITSSGSHVARPGTRQRMTIASTMQPT